MRSRRARRAAASAALCAALPLTGCSAFGTDVRGGAERAAVSPAPASAAPVVMFFGDSYTVGKKGTLPENTYAAATARLLGWQVVLAGRAGTGFVSTGTGTVAFKPLFESQLGWRPAPDLLIISGGHNDARFPPQRVAAAARELLDLAAQRWPGTRRLLIGPLWGNGSPPPDALAVRDALALTAEHAKIPFVDPISEGWITGNHADGTGNAPRYILPDGTHPTVAGGRYVAARLVQDLRRLGLTHPQRGR
ncbi:SGNH/GDSL hydrolase family protein [Actinomadura rayongensis]|uniref:SGNH/GDSL hydrolase family protein n=1 Tax=Actinomadura rayongensis TaxID=1429076 RepID=A0A6I4VZF0_9ACTN|nr:SGNH/GDSL hydrolase family protein [Actinomadura rayongensis]MXQ63367.1 SGNH/GDSL hydrolase family protein [Actinomadura rayongensis]